MLRSLPYYNQKEINHIPNVTKIGPATQHQAHCKNFAEKLEEKDHCKRNLKFFDYLVQRV